MFLASLSLKQASFLSFPDCSSHCGHDYIPGACCVGIKCSKVSYMPYRCQYRSYSICYYHYFPSHPNFLTLRWNVINGLLALLIHSTYSSPQQMLLHQVSPCQRSPINHKLTHGYWEVRSLFRYSSMGTLYPHYSKTIDKLNPNKSSLLPYSPLFFLIHPFVDFDTIPREPSTHPLYSLVQLESPILTPSSILLCNIGFLPCSSSSLPNGILKCDFLTPSIIPKPYLISIPCLSLNPYMKYVSYSCNLLPKWVVSYCSYELER